MRFHACMWGVTGLRTQSSIIGRTHGCCLWSALAMAGTSTAHGGVFQAGPLRRLRRQSTPRSCARPWRRRCSASSASYPPRHSQSPAVSRRQCLGSASERTVQLRACSLEVLVPTVLFRSSLLFVQCSSPATCLTPLVHRPHLEEAVRGQCGHSGGGSDHTRHLCGGWLWRIFYIAWGLFFANGVVDWARGIAFFIFSGASFVVIAALGYQP